MLRRIRIALAAICWLAVTALLLDASGALRAWLGWMAKIQFLPAVLALNVAVIVVIAVVTLLFGRVYCSVICPLGVTQDIISWIHGKTKKKNRFRFGYRKPATWLRLAVLAAFVVLMVLGLASIAALVAPYSAYGRIVTTIARPRTLVTAIVAAVTLAAVVFMSWKYGRLWCNTVCPVGTVLGLLSRWSLFAPVIDTKKCRNCGLCGRACKASCIDTKNHSIDYSRCVDCMDCISNCSEGAVSYTFHYGRKNAGARKPQENGSCSTARVEGTPTQEEAPLQEGTLTQEKAPTQEGRRAFLVGTALVIGGTALKAQNRLADGALAPLTPKQTPQRETPIVPPGAVSQKHLSAHCTACQLCISQCPEHVLRPSGRLESLMQPEMGFEKGYCRPGCTRCSQLCPSGAILPVTTEEKTAIHVGHAVLDFDSCIAYTKGVDCLHCKDACPAHAIGKVRKVKGDNSSPWIPVLIEKHCIGCGACEHLCPVRPVSAIHIEGNKVHIID